ncbi:hypothetical protein LOAG_06633 [Loa loa]|uniref:Uncharacterized protein n=1 Tax=Loa loa TaxID=7209 RepID=A0A1S0TZ24_LOALO|nr:hypothetical protein LOAG_06633 [Loa loa]EFO21855.2 hypothetical protein LOAG_06633 [Loa loa]
MVRSCAGQNSKTANKWRVDQRHQANLTVNLHSKSIRNLINNEWQSRQSGQPSKELKYKYMPCNKDSKNVHKSNQFKNHCKAGNETARVGKSGTRKEGESR